MNKGKALDPNCLLGGAMAGVMIGIGGTVYLACESKVTGAILFSVGLLTICAYGLKLFTGAIGTLLTDRDRSWGRRMGDALQIWLGNLAGTGAVGLGIRLTRPELAEQARTMADAKLAAPLSKVVLMAVFCGILMYLAVDLYRTRTGVHQVAGIFVAVPVFILAGFEHSIADMFYLGAGYGWAVSNLESLVFLLVVTLGNSLGAWGWAAGTKLLKTLQTD